VVFRLGVHGELWTDAFHQHLVALQPRFYPGVKILRRVVQRAVGSGREDARAVALNELDYVRTKMSRCAIHHHDTVLHWKRLEVRKDAPTQEPLKLIGIRRPHRPRGQRLRH
jgi:hypothetical protein